MIEFILPVTSKLASDWIGFVSACPAQSHLKYAVPFFLLDDHLGSILHVPLLYQHIYKGNSLTSYNKA